MSYRLAFVFASASFLLAEQAIDRPQQTSSTERFNFAPGGTIRFNNSFGDLYVEGWDQPQVEMTLIKMFQDYEPRQNAAARLDAVKFTTEHTERGNLT